MEELKVDVMKEIEVAAGASGRVIARHWEITKSQILSMAENGLSIKHIHKLVNKYQYVPLSVIRHVLIEGGYTKNKNRTWSK
jgi:hypothetical protein